MGKVIAVAMQKGGVGKTTTTLNLAAALARLKQSVLVIDLDAQGNLTEHMGYDPESISPTIYDAIRAEIDGAPVDLRDAIYETDEALHLVPAQPELSLIELSLMNALSRERVLQTLIEPVIDEYDYILIDCNPSLGLLVINALTAADGVVVPIQTEYLAARGANMVLSTVETVKRKRLNPDLAVIGIILTMADTRTLISREVLEAVEEQLGGEHKIFEPVIKRSVKFGESAVAGQSIVKYAPKTQGAMAYKKIAAEILKDG